jgi:pimeloyl-ACP methyl ester carboxylesterase
MKFIETTDKHSAEKIKLSYEDVGSGAPVVLIHGWPLSKEMWEYQIAPLVNAGLRVITYDRRGFGKSSKPWNGYDYDSLTDDLHTVITGLNLSNVTLVGFSMGGGEVARYFSKYGGENISKVILISSIVPYMLKTDTNPDGVPENKMDEMMNDLKNDRIGFLEEFGKFFFGINLINHPLSEPLLNYYLMLESIASPKATQDCMIAFGHTDFRSDAVKINVPALIIHGGADKTVPIDATSQQAAKLIPDNTFVIYDGAPHGLFYTEKERLNADLISFITEGKVESLQPDYYIPMDSVILPSNEPLITR